MEMTQIFSENKIWDIYSFVIEGKHNAKKKINFPALKILEDINIKYISYINKCTSGDLVLED